MKTRILILIGITAVATLSFTFVSVKSDKNIKSQTITTTNSHDGEPVGGFLSEDKLKY